MPDAPEPLETEEAEEAEAEAAEVPSGEGVQMRKSPDFPVENDGKIHFSLGKPWKNQKVLEFVDEKI